MDQLNQLSRIPLRLETRPSQGDWALYWGGTLVEVGTLSHCLSSLEKASVEYCKEGYFDLNNGIEVLLGLLGLGLPSEASLVLINQNIIEGELQIQKLREEGDAYLVQRVYPEYNPE